MSDRFRRRDAPPPPADRPTDPPESRYRAIRREADEIGREIAWRLRGVLTWSPPALRRSRALPTLLPTLPPELRTLRLDLADSGPRIRRDLVAALERSGVALQPADATGVAVLRVPVNAVATEALTISEQARVREFAVRHRVVFELRLADGRVLVPEQELLLERDFVFDERDALGVAGQEEALRRDLEREMVRALMRRIERAADSLGGGAMP